MSSDEEGTTVSNPQTLPEEEAHRLKALAERNYTSGNLKLALKLANRAHKLQPLLDGLPEMITALKILLEKAEPTSKNSTFPDYYKILQVERFSHINLIKKQYKKLALTLHPDKNRFSGCEEAFKLVGEAVGVLSDKIRRKEYDLRLRIGMMGEEELGDGDGDGDGTFWTACGNCRMLHQFERRYLGHSLVCPTCKKGFVANEVVEEEEEEVEVEEEEEEVEVEEEEEGDDGAESEMRVSARITERVARGGKVGALEGEIGDCGMVMDVDDDEEEEDGLLKDMMLRREKRLGKLSGGDGGKLKKVRKLADVNDGVGMVENKRAKRAKVVEEESMTLSQLQMRVRGGVKEAKSAGVETGESGRVKRAKARGDESMTLSQLKMKGKKGVEEDARSSGVETGESDRAKRTKAREEEAMTLSQMQMKAKNKVDEEAKSVGIEKVESGRAKRAKAREEETMTLSELQILARKKVNEGKLTVKGKEVDVEKEKGKENGKDKEEVDEETENQKRESEKEKESRELEDMEMPNEEEKDKRTEIVYTRKKRNRQTVSWYKDFEVENLGASENDSLEVMVEGREIENENVSKKEKEKEMDGIREKRERRRVSKYGDLESLNRKRSENHIDSQIERLNATKKGNVEIMPVEDSDFHDFDKDRRQRSFKKGQVWAVYDDDDGMPRHYSLIDEIVSVKPFEVSLRWLQFESSGDDELLNWQKMGFHVSCGRFKVSGKVSINYLNLFSHVVDCERAAREVYRIYPRKGSVWAMYNNNALDNDGRDQRVKDKQLYDIVICLTSYSDAYGLSVAHLVRVDGFRTVFKRREIGANAVIWLGKNNVKLLSHQIPATKLSGEEASGLPKDCWELDPASLTPQSLIAS